MHLPTPRSGMADHELQGFSTKARAASELLKALAHHTRLLILCILAEEEKTVSEIEDILGMQQAMVSQQLARLRLEGLVNTRREGRMIYYSVGHSGTVSLLKSLFVMLPEVVEQQG
ncbi:MULTISPECIES: ArsR/SmtB family transcription factor [unclassified Rhizobium]|uniref:ArsR/SmtB family transcription factor n=1 Tax=unclassified Rhizobium TaxID=2613769 RepID=UPI000DB98573|nr:metalloregulator ArsR/SmtB family transcription factor [Rhizobium sp. 16-449-1b]MBO9195565.1 winged helix-turn-helix transcriptional regulator [Rhizobium sp. 16-449-1b]